MLNSLCRIYPKRKQFKYFTNQLRKLDTFGRFYFILYMRDKICIFLLCCWQPLLKRFYLWNKRIDVSDLKCDWRHPGHDIIMKHHNSNRRGGEGNIRTKQTSDTVTLVISTSPITNNHLSRRENVLPVWTWTANNRQQNIMEKRKNPS